MAFRMVPVEADRNLFLLPSNPSVGHDSVQYCDGGLWDGGLFQSFADRQNLVFHKGSGWGRFEADNTSTLVFKPLSINEQQWLYQTWFFFGLLAELCSLNSIDDGTPSLRPSNMPNISIEGLYSAWVVSDGTGTRRISSETLIRDGFRIDALFPEALKKGVKHRGERYRYLSQCLHLTIFSINHPNVKLQPAMRDLICSLGELIEGVLTYAAELETIHEPIATFPWGRGYLTSEIEGKMYQEGWCRSEIERIRRSFNSFNSQYLISRLKKPGSQPRDHSRCTKRNCKLAQIDNDKYKLTHVVDGCTPPCDEIEIDVNRVVDILLDKSTFPVLSVDTADGDLNNLTIAVEPFKGDETPYIALSHVWADGLGNPNRNSLHRCQVKRLHALIQGLPMPTGGTKSVGSTRRWLWVDTLCCPVTKAAKARIDETKKAYKISLELMATVYRQASHVLVLDASCSAISLAKTSILEACFWAFAASRWMGRLWTLQEGALAKSLYFQFEDYSLPILAAMLLIGEEIRKCGDMKFIKMLSDLQQKLTNLNLLGVVPDDGALQHSWMEMKLQALQAAVYFRSVSEPLDEPLCIATLLSLDVGKVLQEDNREKRMACVWKLWTDASGGFPSAVIFLMDDPLPIPGWGWAPASLLGSESSTALTYDDALSRLKLIEGSKHLGSVVENLGLKVQLPGLHVRIKSWRKGGPIRLWDWNSTGSEELFLMCWHASSRKWYMMWDQKRAVARDNLGLAEMELWDRQNPHPLRECLLSGSDMVLIQDIVMPRDGRIYHLLAELLGPIPENSSSSMSSAERAAPFALYVHGRRTVTLVKLDDSWIPGLNRLREIAIQIAQNEAMTDLLISTGRTSQEQKAAAAKLGDFMNSRMAQAYQSDPVFKRFCTETLLASQGFGNLVPLYLPYDVELSDVQDDPYWVVDRAEITAGTIRERTCP